MRTRRKKSPNVSIYLIVPPKKKKGKENRGYYNHVLLDLIHSHLGHLLRHLVYTALSAPQHNLAGADLGSKLLPSCCVCSAALASDAQDLGPVFGVLVLKVTVSAELDVELVGRDVFTEVLIENEFFTGLEIVSGNSLLGV